MIDPRDNHTNSLANRFSNGGKGKRPSIGFPDSAEYLDARKALRLAEEGTLLIPSGSSTNSKTMKLEKDYKEYLFVPESEEGKLRIEMAEKAVEIFAIELTLQHAHKRHKFDIRTMRVIGKYSSDEKEQTIKALKEECSDTVIELGTLQFSLDTLLKPDSSLDESHFPEQS